MHELINPQQDISKEFLKIADQLRKTQKPDRMFYLTREPTRDELKFLIDNLRSEIGLVHLIQPESWVMIEGTRGEVRMLRKSDELIDISAHYHPSRRNASTHLPSVLDVLNINPKGKNFVFNRDGLTYFSGFEIHPITGLPWRQQDREKIGLIQLLYVENSSSKQYVSREQFLDKMGVKIVRKTWRELPNEKPLSNFSMAVHNT